jgi:hypothetical protein
MRPGCPRKMGDEATSCRALLFKITRPPREHRRDKGPVDGTSVLRPSTPAALPPLLPPHRADAARALTRPPLRGAHGPDSLTPEAARPFGDSSGCSRRRARSGCRRRSGGGASTGSPSPGGAAARWPRRLPAARGRPPRCRRRDAAHRRARARQARSRALPVERPRARAVADGARRDPLLSATRARRERRPSPWGGGRSFVRHAVSRSGGRYHGHTRLSARHTAQNTTMPSADNTAITPKTIAVFMLLEAVRMR